MPPAPHRGATPENVRLRDGGTRLPPHRGAMPASSRAASAHGTAPVREPCVAERRLKTFASAMVGCALKSLPEGRREHGPHRVAVKTAVWSLIVTHPTKRSAAAHR